MKRNPRRTAPVSRDDILELGRQKRLALLTDPGRNEPLSHDDFVFVGEESIRMLDKATKILDVAFRNHCDAVMELDNSG